MRRLEHKGEILLVYETTLEEGSLFEGHAVTNDLEAFIKQCRGS